MCVVCVRVCGGVAGLRASGGEKKEGGEGVQCACRVVFFLCFVYPRVKSRLKSKNSQQVSTLAHEDRAIPPFPFYL